MLHSIDEAARLLGGISPWTLRKHISSGRLRVVRLGRRVFVDAEELERIRRDGLPSLRVETSGKVAPTTNLNSQEETEESCLTNLAC
jgi:excisionase family DNA binding protein